MHRKYVLETMCREGVSSNDYIDDAKLGKCFLVSRRSGLVYCSLGAVGGSYLSRLLQKLDLGTEVDNSNSSNDGTNITRVENLSDVQFYNIHHIFQTSKNFMFVSDPYARLFSVFIDNLFIPNSDFWSNFGVDAIRKFRSNASLTSLGCGHDVTFKEFLELVLHLAEEKQFRDENFEPMNEICKPCRIHYDFIGKLETLERDVSSVIELANMASSTINLQGEYVVDQITNYVKNIFLEIKYVDDCITITESLKRTWKALQFKGFIQQHINLNASGSESDIMEDEILREFMQAKDDYGVNFRHYYRNDDMVDAYSTIPKELMRKIQIFVLPDCELFGYDPEPNDLFENDKERTLRWNLLYDLDN